MSATFARRTTTNYIIVHGTGTKPSEDIGLFEVDRLHRQLGYLCCGHHFIIRRNGVVEPGRGLTQVGAHCGRERNLDSISICLVGGAGETGADFEDNYTLEQKIALVSQLSLLRDEFPDAQVVGHRDLKQDVTCPGFEVKEFYVVK